MSTMLKLKYIRIIDSETFQSKNDYSSEATCRLKPHSSMSLNMSLNMHLNSKKVSSRSKGEFKDNGAVERENPTPLAQSAVVKRQASGDGLQKAHFKHINSLPTLEFT